MKKTIEEICSELSNSDIFKALKEIEEHGDNIRYVENSYVEKILKNCKEGNYPLYNNVTAALYKEGSKRFTTLLSFFKY